MSGSSSDAQADAVLVPEAEKAATVADIIVQPPAKTRKVEKEVAPKVLAPKNNQKNLAGVVNINLPVGGSNQCSLLICPRLFLTFSSSSPPFRVVRYALS